MDAALQNSLKLLIHRSTIHLWRILPFKTWAPVLTVLRIYLVLSSHWNFRAKHRVMI